MRWKQRRVNEYSARSIIKRVFGEDDQEKERDLRAVMESENMYIQLYSDKTFLNRLAYCFLFPIVLVIAPFQWLAYGDFGFSVNDRVGRFCLKLLGEYK